MREQPQHGPRTLFAALFLVSGFEALAQEAVPDATFVESVLSSADEVGPTIVNIQGCVMVIEAERHMDPSECRNPKFIVWSHEEVDLRTVGEVTTSPVRGGSLMVSLVPYGWPFGAEEVGVPFVHFDYCDGTEFVAESTRQSSVFFFRYQPLSEGDLRRVNAYLRTACPRGEAPGS